MRPTRAVMLLSGTGLHRATSTNAPLLYWHLLTL